jgi:hypothetical protein
MGVRGLSVLAGLGAAVGLLLTGCGGGGGDETPSVNVAGTWVGTGHGSVLGEPIDGATTLVLSQGGNNVRGTWDGFAVGGILESNLLTVTLDPVMDQGVTLNGSFSFTATGSELLNGKGTLSGTRSNQTLNASITFSTLTRSSKEQAELIGVFAPQVIDALRQ